MGSISTDWNSLAEIDPEFKELLDTLGPLPSLASAPSVPAARELLAQLFAAVGGVTVPENMNGVAKRRIGIPVRDGTEIGALVYRPESGERGPLVVLHHGGGWWLGGAEMAEVNCVNLVQLYGCVCVIVDYRLAPEHPFPVPVEDSWNALKWIAANASDLGADPSKGFIVGGESAGGNLTVALSLLARDEKLSPPLTGLWPCIPAVLSPDVVPEKYAQDYNSREQNKDAPGLDAKTIEVLMSAKLQPRYLLAALQPLPWPTGHAGLPPAYFQVCGLDPLRDVALLYERVLREEYGVKTKLDVYPGLPHAFWGLFPHLKSSRAFIQDLVRGFAWLLGREEREAGNREPAPAPAVL